jgi:hypothetical protein
MIIEKKGIENLIVALNSPWLASDPSSPQNLSNLIPLSQLCSSTKISLQLAKSLEISTTNYIIYTLSLIPLDVKSVSSNSLLNIYPLSFIIIHLLYSAYDNALIINCDALTDIITYYYLLLLFLLIFIIMRLLLCTFLVHFELF